MHRAARRTSVYWWLLSLQIERKSLDFQTTHTAEIHQLSLFCWYFVQTFKVHCVIVETPFLCIFPHQNIHVREFYPIPTPLNICPILDSFLPEFKSQVRSLSWCVVLHQPIDNWPEYFSELYRALRNNRPLCWQSLLQQYSAAGGTPYSMYFAV